MKKKISSPSFAYRVALAGNPNCGKTSLFNQLTGLNQKVGNFPGVTVDKKTGTSKINSSIDAEIVDLPGTYSLYPKTEDEAITSSFLLDNDPVNKPDLVILVVDSGNLKRNLLLVTQIIDTKIHCLLALNMIDEAQKKKIEINYSQLSNSLGIKVVPIIARTGFGIEDLKNALNVDPNQLLPRHKIITEEGLSQNEETILRFKKIGKILESSVVRGKSLVSESRTYKIDKVLTHKFWGFFIFIALLGAIFQSIYSFASYPMDWIESFFSGLNIYLESALPSGMLTDLLLNGILSGLSGVLIFIPQIAFLFAFIAILEDTGYMARVSFIMDRILRKFGLNGKSIIPLISGTACAVPAIMSARTINNPKERLITILVTPLMSCSARIPVYTLLIALVIPPVYILGIFDLQGLTLLALYLIGFIAAIGSAFIFKYILKSKEKSYFILEMPEYRAPRWSNIGITILEKVKLFVFEAGKIIMAVSIILWALSSFGPANKFDEIERKYTQLNQQNTQNKTSSMASEKLEASYAGIIGKTIEPAIKPLGFDWKIGISLITSFAAREVFVGTLATIFSVGDPDNKDSIKAKMHAETFPGTFEKKYPFATGISLMLFFAFAMQCMSTTAIVYRETKHWKWPIIQFLYLGILAYAISFISFNLLS